MEDKELCPKCRQAFGIMELIEHADLCQGASIPILTPNTNGKVDTNTSASVGVQKQIRLEQMESTKICSECGAFGRRATSNFCTECGGLLRDRNKKENELKKKLDKKDELFKEVKKDLNEEKKTSKKENKKYELYLEKE